MKTRLLITALIISSIIVLSIFFIFYMFANDSSSYKVLDVKMNVIGIKQFYEIGEPVSFSVHVNSLGKTVPWPTLRIYQDYVDISSEPVYSRMYMTPIESEDKQKSLEWREKTWNFPLESDDPIRFFDKGNYTLRVDVDAKKHSLINFQVVNPINEFEIIDDFNETFGGLGNRHPAFLGYSAMLASRTPYHRVASPNRPSPNHECRWARSTTYHSPRPPVPKSSKLDLARWCPPPIQATSTSNSQSPSIPSLRARS